MKKRKTHFQLITGSLLILISCILIVTSQINIQQGAKKSEKIIAEMKTLLPDKSVGIPNVQSTANMPILEIVGTDYVAMLEIPALNTTVPIADKWQDKSYTSPARFFGSAYNNTLVIGGENYSHQFAFCGEIENNTNVLITDVRGTQFSYTVTDIERRKKPNNSWLINNNYDLTLFCKDSYSMEYIAVRCTSTYNK